MTEEEFPFKVGDVVWYVTGPDWAFEATRCTVTRFNKWKFEPFEVVTISVDMAGFGRITCLPNTLHLKPPVLRRYSLEEKIATLRFKTGDRVMHWRFGYGVVLGFSAALTMRVDFKFLGEQAVEPTDPSIQFAQAGDEDVDPRAPKPKPEPVPEPLCKLELATVENLALEIDDWIASVHGFSLGFDCSEEYQHDLMARESVHGMVNGLRHKGIAIPAELQARLDEADRWFLALTKDDSGVWPDAERYDRDVFWYYFRWLR